MSGNVLTWSLFFFLSVFLVVDLFVVVFAVVCGNYIFM